jgi:hypothetical protein
MIAFVVDHISAHTRGFTLIAGMPYDVEYERKVVDTTKGTRTRSETDMVRMAFTSP